MDVVRLACQDGLQAVLGLLEALQLQSDRTTRGGDEDYHWVSKVRVQVMVPLPTCQDGLQPVLCLLEALQLR
jgi:hypothetical protein